MRAVTFAMALVSLGLAAGACAEDVFGPTSVPPAAQSFHVGTLKLTVLHDAQIVMPNDAKTFGVDVGAGPVSELLRAAGAPTDRVTLSVNVLLFRTGRRVLLLDAGLGPKAHGGLLASLGQAGVPSSAVTDVLVTQVFSPHFAFPGVGHVAADGGAFSWIAGIP